MGPFLAGRRLLLRPAATPQAPAGAGGGDRGPVTNDEQRFWDAAQSLQSPDRKIPALDAYLSTYPAGAFAMLAKLQLDDLRAKQAAAEGRGQHRPVGGHGRDCRHQPDEPARGCRRRSPRH